MTFEVGVEVVVVVDAADIEFVIVVCWFVDDSRCVIMFTQMNVSCQFQFQ